MNSADTLKRTHPKLAENPQHQIRQSQYKIQQNQLGNFLFVVKCNFSSLDKIIGVI